MSYKLTLLLLVISFTKTSFSQNTRFGVQAGATLASMHANYGEDSESTDSKFGFTGGLFLQTPIGKNVMFSPALNYVQKGGKEPDLDPDEVSDITLNYLELPLNIFYSTKGFFVGGGPVLSLGLSGKERYSDMNGEIKTDKINFGSDPDEAKQFEFSGNLLAGYQFKNGLMISGGYNMGFSNLVNTEDNNDGKLTNRFWSLKVGYLFSKK